MRYTLTTGPSIQLKPHVGHKIEITGHLKDLSTADTAARPGSGSAGEASATGRRPQHVRSGVDEDGRGNLSITDERQETPERSVPRFAVRCVHRL